MAYRLLEKFRDTFAGSAYRHRDASLGDAIAVMLYEDLYAIGRSASFQRRIGERTRAVNLRNLLRGRPFRRGDGTFGEPIPGAELALEEGAAVPRGALATIEIGVEVKILLKAMIKQIDRVATTFCDQAADFRKGNPHAVTVGIAGVNHAARTVGYEGARRFETDGRRHKHPIQEAAEAMRRLRAEAAPCYDEFVILPFVAVNEPPFDFSWVDENQVELDYAAALARIAALYQRRFP